MKRGLLIMIALVASTFLAHFFMKDTGYALVHFRGYAIETSLLGLLLFGILAYVAVRLVTRSLTSVSDLGRAAGRYQKKRSRSKLTRGLIELAEGNYARSERMLAESAHKSDTPVLNYLHAARAAQEQGATDRRDNWLMMAYENDVDSSRAVLLTQAELQSRDGDYERALATLRKLEEQSPGHPQGLALLARIYERLGDWDNLQELLPQLRKRKALPVDDIDQLAQRTWATLLTHDGETGDVTGLQRQWQKVPKKLKSDPIVLRDYVEALHRAGEHALVEQTIRKALKKNWDPALLNIYSELENVDTARSLAFVQGLLKSRGDEPQLLLAAGQLALRAGQAGEARTYLEKSIRLDPSPDAYQTLGAVLAETGDAEDSASAFRKGLALATGRVESTLPALRNKDEPQPEQDSSAASPG
ncbi:MAG: tetratricopeptide repeat protein [Gammaproteobacteria bacterium]|nr:tetratricopeptide repeat protein [Gammaproteobacteria bacterium]NNF60198.1 tetratricopeptide repeat protein [Gammaproteobacteria bacterium]NNM21611.1 tetratricopeptide repeat protein [Gammaproteobacteria bacterium]